MKRNIGSLDRTIRIVAGIFLISLAFWGPKSPWGWLGLVPLVTAAIGYCPPYQLLGISTCRNKPK